MPTPRELATAWLALPVGDDSMEHALEKHVSGLRMDEAGPQSDFDKADEFERLLQAAQQARREGRVTSYGHRAAIENGDGTLSRWAESLHDLAQEKREDAIKVDPLCEKHPQIFERAERKRIQENFEQATSFDRNAKDIDNSRPAFAELARSLGIISTRDTGPGRPGGGH